MELKTSVVVIGAGPTGLMAANQLARFGIDLIILDSKSGPTEQSRAIAVTSRSLEIYEQMGLSDQVLAEGQKIDSFHFYAGGKERGKIELGTIGKGYTDFNFFLGFEQSKNEELLYSHLKNSGHEVMWNSALTSFTQDTEKVICEVNHQNKKISVVARYLIGCDGAGSAVRHQLNLSFKGGTYENRFFVADTILGWKLGYQSLVISPGANNFVAFFPMKGKSNYRVIGTLPDEYNDNPDIQFNDIENTVIRTLGTDVQFEKVNWFSTYRLHHRRVDKFHEGRVFLAGDAAHIHSPAGGQGMNTGLQDAYNLAWKMGFVIRGYAHPVLLDTYDEERLPFARWLLSFTDRGFRMMTSDHPLVSFLRQNFAKYFVGLMLKNKIIRPFAFRTVSQIWYSYAGRKLSGSNSNQRLKFRAGDRLPYIHQPDEPFSLYRSLAGPSFYLLHISKKKGEGDAEILNFRMPVEYISLPLDEYWIRLGVKKTLYILVRPDHYIGFISDTYDHSIFEKHYKDYFLTR